MSASILGKAHETAGCFPIASCIVERIIVFRWERSGENNCFPDVFYHFSVEISTSKPERPIKILFDMSKQILDIC